MVPSWRVYPRTWMVAPLGLDVGVWVVIADTGAVSGVVVGPGDGVDVSVAVCCGILPTDTSAARPRTLASRLSALISARAVCMSSGR
jgi:hypothetical protein